MSSQPWPPAARRCRRIAAARPLALTSSKYSGRPAKDVRPWVDDSASYWKSSRPCATIAHPVGDGRGFANQDYRLDSPRPTGNFKLLMQNPGNSEGNLKEADAAEERIIDEMRHLGR